MKENASATKSLRETASRLLSEEKVAAVIGYARRNGADMAVPVFVRRPEDAEQLVFDDGCFGNLAVYLAKSEVRALGKLGIVVKGCDLRTVNVLLREHVVDRDDVYLIGVRCAGVDDSGATRCAACESHDPDGCDVVVGDPVDQPKVNAEDRYKDAAEMETRSPEERWEFWRRELDRCIRCYACRQACPLCYCKRCIVEKTAPQWVESSPHLRGNIAWHVARALHVTGRCVGCGQCERVCPVGIPLNAVNQKMAKIVDEWFGFRSGQSPDEQGPFSTFSEDDPEIEIL